ncbi:uncharacterized protein C8Q71DRAFT_741322 [Rhodofomes roseus]|uniref:Uncharacterized protein n=1 Tax=Rhodofomes roseus TaxID=34475 RepID=A0ABQ8KS87_9APHY|nr:uncharacterized protein C8Q71DRAFT_741322 [Rhodofomes roseus]KAH9840804.1 hypothetical protein C8Q71DRAFT_741322 [Rhodofomes roseus]
MEHAVATASEVTINAPCDVGALVGVFFAANEDESNMQGYLGDAACIARDCRALGVEDASAVMLAARVRGQHAFREGHDFLLSPSLRSPAEGVAAAYGEHSGRDVEGLVDAGAGHSDDKTPGDTRVKKERIQQPLAAKAAGVVAEQPIAKGFAYHIKEMNQRRLNVPSPVYSIATSNTDSLQSSSQATLPTPPSEHTAPKRKRKPGKPGAGSSKKYKRQRNAQEKGNKKEQRQLSRLQHRLVSGGTTVTMLSFNLKTGVNVTKSGWQGQTIPKISREDIIARWRDGRIKDDVACFLPIPFNGEGPPSVLKVLDVQDRLFFYRGFPAPFLNPEVFAYIHDTLISDSLMSKAERDDAINGRRGPHLASIAGHWRQSASRPSLTKWHLDNKAKVDAILEYQPFIDLNRLIESTLKTAFPKVYERFLLSAEWHKIHSGVSPLFGGYWNFCLNGIFPDQDRVHCMPHADAKNPVGICVLMVYVLPNSKFNSKHRSWLVVWEAGIVVEMPPWTPVMYPSSLFLHFNIDVHDIEFVVTDGDWPTKHNSRPIDGDDCGRGSMVWFNMATMIQTSETGHATLKKAAKAGVKITSDYDAEVERAFLTASSLQTLAGSH